MMSTVDPVSSVILWVTLLFFLGIIGSTVAKKLGQSAVLGELLMGVLVGNLGFYFSEPLSIILREGPALFEVMGHVLSGDVGQLVLSSGHKTSQIMAILSGPYGQDWLKVAYVVDSLSRYGVIFLLFMVGLDSSFNELKRTGRAAIQVALIGVIVPIVLGFLVTWWLVPSASFKADLFVAATLSATSIGITARVLRDLSILHTREAKTILGAAMFDDVLGLIILAVVCSLVIHGSVESLALFKIIGMVGLFFLMAIVAGPWILRLIIGAFSGLDEVNTKLYVSFIFLMALSWLAAQVELATIMGAFVAGMLIHDGLFKKTKTNNNLSIKEILTPFELIFSPLFFILIGMQVKLETFANQSVLILSLGLIVVAIIGKLVSGFGANKLDDRILIGIGMLPRGEVGLVFAATGRSMGVISDELFTAIVVMILVTTLIAPPWLKYRCTRAC